MEKKIVVPYAPILVESTRSIGYSFEAAVSDIIDNSISASATEIRVCFSSQDPQWLCIEDNGWGMTAEELEVGIIYAIFKARTYQPVEQKSALIGLNRNPAYAERICNGTEEAQEGIVFPAHDGGTGRGLAVRTG